MRRCVLACAVVEAELRPFVGDEVEFRVLEQGLHRTPDRLRESLQREIDSIDAEEILLGYGLCGNGVAGLTSTRSRLVVPRVDDCISILLGSYERYLEEFRREPGTYWLSHGWIQHARNPYKEYHRCREKWDEETARWVASETLKGYRRLALIDTGACPLDRVRGHAREFADFFELEYVEMAGSDHLARALLSGERQEGEFVVAEPGQAISTDSFLPSYGTANG